MSAPSDDFGSGTGSDPEAVDATMRNSMQRRSKLWMWPMALAALVSLQAACTQAPTPPDKPTCDALICNHQCYADPDCKDYPGQTWCDVASNLCVACLGDHDCGAGQACSAAHTCAPSCSAQRACPMGGGVCEVDGGTCVECVSSADCTDPARPSCDALTHSCFACSPGADKCGLGTYCAASAPAPHCAPGCKDDADCAANVADGGIPDGGAAGAGHCDTGAHQCVECLANGDCKAGSVCRAGKCGPGCSDQQPCAGGQTCCGGACIDTSHDGKNCGACNRVCPGGENCCAGDCSDPIADVKNCGGCGIACAAANGTPRCAGSTCQVAFCKDGWADCNGLYTDGCETDLTANVDNCGSCNNVCNITHAQSKCVQPDPKLRAGACAVDVCLAPWADCDGQVGNGCEIALDVDALHCGGCANACSKNHVSSPACRNSACVGACDKGFSDCNGDKLTDGCEITTDSDTANCGACGRVCSSVNGAPSCKVGACDIACGNLYGNCDNDIATGCETNLRTLTDCGACGKSCVLDNSNPTCGDGTCKIGTCAPGFADCDVTAANGCEIAIAGDVNNCGGCNDANNSFRCSAANVVAPLCIAGSCVSVCAPGFADCNGDKRKDGCEVSIGNDVANCGACGHVCSNANGAASCNAGVCAIQCKPGYRDCDGDLANGCETALNSNTNCGGCGVLCGAAHATTSCSTGACVVTACAPGFADCDGRLDNGCEVDTTLDPANCGACGSACSPAGVAQLACAGGVCSGACAAGFADCNGDKKRDGCEVAIASDLKNCGACGRVCSSANGTPQCNGACTIMCSAGYKDCDGDVTNGCETALNTNSNCGGCNVACSAPNAITSCGTGTCTIATCAPGFADCQGGVGNGCETAIATDTANCGGCGRVCPGGNGTPTCTSGACGIACFNGFRDCDGNANNGCEALIAADPNNCGACNNRCSANNVAGQLCGGGQCNGQCRNGFADCNGNMQVDGCETNLASDAANCGGCYKACSANHVLNPTCSARVCNGVCVGAWADCNNDKLSDGCEIDTNNDPGNCGGCGKVCSNVNIAAPTCAAASCNGACNANFADCNNNKLSDGCEVDLMNDIKNCGGCGVVCGGATTCVAGVCK